jgi:hypothetical protein
MYNYISLGGGTMEIRFVKVGNNYVNVLNIEKFNINETGIHFTTISGNKYILTERPAKDDDFAMKRLIRKINEKAYDIIYLEEFLLNDEAFR